MQTKTKLFKFMEGNFLLCLLAAFLTRAVTGFMTNYCACFEDKLKIF